MTKVLRAWVSCLLSTVSSTSPDPCTGIPVWWVNSSEKSVRPRNGIRLSLVQGTWVLLVLLGPRVLVAWSPVQVVHLSIIGTQPYVCHGSHWVALQQQRMAGQRQTRDRS